MTTMAKRPVSRLNREEKWYAYAMISPVVLGFFCLLLFPLLYEFYLSFTDTKLLGEAHFVGFENYVTLFTADKYFVKSMGNSIYFTVGVVALNVSTAIVLAVLLNKPLKSIGVFRTLVFMPNITPVVVWAIVWRYILSTDVGVLNGLLRMVGIEGPAWLFDMKLTMPVIIINTVMKGVGLNVVMILSALKSIPNVYYEAARIDGANELQQFKNVTIPLLSPTLFMVLVTTVIGAMKIFANVFVLTGGGPARTTQLIVMYIYHRAFKQYEFGYAAAISVVMFLILLGITMVQWSLRRKMVYAEND